MLRDLGIDKEWTRARREAWWQEHGRDRPSAVKRDDESSAHVRIAPHPQA
jgi:hypothetical protein